MKINSNTQYNQPSRTAFCAESQLVNVPIRAANILKQSLTPMGTKDYLVHIEKDGIIYYASTFYKGVPINEKSPKLTASNENSLINQIKDAINKHLGGLSK